MRGDDPVAAEIAAWSMTFESGHDYFFDLEPHGVVDPTFVASEHRTSARRTWKAKVRKAWQRLGKRYLAGWKPKGPLHRQAPWALTELGQP
jgi:hypothetical protein